MVSSYDGGLSITSGCDFLCLALISTLCNHFFSHCIFSLDVVYCDSGYLVSPLCIDID